MLSWLWWGGRDGGGAQGAGRAGEDGERRIVEEAAGEVKAAAAAVAEVRAEDGREKEREDGVREDSAHKHETSRANGHAHAVTSGSTDAEINGHAGNGVADGRAADASSSSSAHGQDARDASPATTTSSHASTRTPPTRAATPSTTSATMTTTSATPTKTNASPARTSGAAHAVTTRTTYREVPTTRGAGPRTIEIAITQHADEALDVLAARLARLELQPSFFLTAPATVSATASAATAGAPPRTPFDMHSYASRARFLLSTHPSLAQWRYKLVPTRICELDFWRNVFARLDEAEQREIEEARVAQAEAEEEAARVAEEAARAAEEAAAAVREQAEEQIDVQSDARVDQDDSNRAGHTATVPQTPPRTPLRTSQASHPPSPHSEHHTAPHDLQASQPHADPPAPQTTHAKSASTSSTPARPNEELASTTNPSTHTSPSTSASSAAATSSLSAQSSKVGDLMRDVLQYQAQLAQKQAEIDELRRQLEDARRASATAHRECHRCKTKVSSRSAQEPCHFHGGEWKLDKMSRDFFALDATLRENLRQEKRKRLAAVQHEMRWIVDTDDTANAPGVWSCCQAAEHASRGCRRAAEHDVA